MNNNKKIAFFGTPNFTVEFLDMLKNNNFNVELVVTGEDKPVGRGMQMKSPGPKHWAVENNIKVIQPEKLDDTELQDFDLFIVIAYGKIISEKIINLPKYGTINLHYSLLPKYRGASPVESAILNNDEVTGITIQKMAYKLDAGDILFQEEMKIENDDTTNVLRTKLNQRALEIFPEFMDNLFEDKITSTPQNESEATKCGKFSKEDFNVSKEVQENDLKTIYTKYKAFDKRTYFFHNNVRVKITDMNENTINKVLPENKNEITVEEFERAFGKIFN